MKSPADILDRLAKTEDGLTCYPGMMVWVHAHIGSSTQWSWVELEIDRVGAGDVEFVVTPWLTADRYYGTLQAAETAQAEREEVSTHYEP